MTKRTRKNSIDSLPEDLRAKVRSMLQSKKPRFTLAQIKQAVYDESNKQHAVSIASLHRYWHNVLETELDDAERRADFSVALSKRVARAVGIKSKGPKKIAVMEGILLDVIDSAFLAATTDPTALDPDDLITAHTNMARTQIMRENLELRKRRVDLQFEKLEMEKQALERTLAKERKAQKAKIDKAAKAIDKAAQFTELTQSEAGQKALAAIRKSLGIKEAS